MEQDLIDLHLIHLPESGFEEIFPRLEPYLTGEEVEAANRFIFERHRLLYAASHAFMRIRLGASLGREPKRIEIVRGEYGKPALKDEALEFNLSHTLGLAMLGMSPAGTEVGVDVERVDDRRDHAGLARSVFTEEERREWSGDVEGFFDRWTLKESYIKARGAGLSLDLQRFGISLSGEPRLTCGHELDDPESWRFTSFVPTGRHRAAAAARVAFRDAEVRWNVEETDLASLLHEV